MRNGFLGWIGYGKQIKSYEKDCKTSQTFSARPGEKEGPSLYYLLVKCLTLQKPADFPEETSEQTVIRNLDVPLVEKYVPTKQPRFLFVFATRVHATVVEAKHVVEHSCLTLGAGAGDNKNKVFILVSKKLNKNCFDCGF